MKYVHRPTTGLLFALGMIAIALLWLIPFEHHTLHSDGTFDIWIMGGAKIVPWGEIVYTSWLPPHMPQRDGFWSNFDVDIMPVGFVVNVVITIGLLSYLMWCDRHKAWSRGQYRRDKELCLRCGYRLASGSNTCPECGSQSNEAT